MKNVFLIFWLIVFTSISLVGQNSKINVIPKIGLSFNSVYDPSDWETRFSPFLVGIELNKLINENFSVSIDLSYVRKGPHRIGDNKTYASEDYLFDFIIISGNLNYLISEESRLESIFGLYSGVVFNSKVKTSTTIEDFDMENRIIDFGLNISLRKYLNILNNDFFIEPKYQLGFLKVSNSKQISFQIILGLRIK